MKFLKSGFRITALVLAMVAASPCKADDLVPVSSDSLALEFRLEKNRYLFGQDIFGTAILSNLTTRTLAISDIRYPDYCLSVLDGSGGKLSSRGSYPNWGRIPPFLLPPGDSIISVIQLCDDYAFSESDDKASCITIGDESIYAVYSNVLLSIEVPIQVVEPTGDELAAYRLLRDARSTARQRDLTQSMAIIDSIARYYSTSEYLVESCKFGILTAKMSGDSNRINNYGRQIIASHPNDLRAIPSLDRILEITPVLERGRVCDSVTQEVPGTRIADYAQRVKSRKEIKQ